MAREADQNNSSRPDTWKGKYPKDVPVNAHKVMATGENREESDLQSLMREHVEPKPR